jgi:hypothetical protein
MQALPAKTITTPDGQVLVVVAGETRVISLEVNLTVYSSVNGVLEPTTQAITTDHADITAYISSAAAPKGKEYQVEIEQQPNNLGLFFVKMTPQLSKAIATGKKGEITQSYLSIYSLLKTDLYPPVYVAGTQILHPYSFNSVWYSWI